MLSQAFYKDNDVTSVAKGLLGKRIVTLVGNAPTAGIIVETEAYSGAVERGSHAFPMKRTNRTSVMFQTGGIAYVYLCYGVHHLFNVVTNIEGQPDAVLIRALEPVDGMDTMMKRRCTTRLQNLTSGPGKLSAALGINTRDHNQASLFGPHILIEEGIEVPSTCIVASTRIGIDYAGEDAKLPWRFYLKGNGFVSQF